ncbi:YgdB family protein [Rahnella bruchi]|uniref:YgdB family protein n=1 Tax=Rahnella bruchi TaxID=1510573 RepID=UPI000EA25E91|nr:YgdB family protein [Rahnella bruchi]
MILSIMVMMGLALIALSSLQQQLSAGLALTSNQHRFVIAWENASSALAWGISQPWKAFSDARWQCQDVPAMLISSDGGRVCVRASLRQDVYVLRAEGTTGEGKATVKLFQQASMKKQADGKLSFSPLKQGWLDFCPEADEQVCND